MIALGLNCLLALLLACGLVMGIRLDRKLRGLRDSHAGFAKAVQELDRAALRTEASLAELRAGTETARSELAARIDQARLLAHRLGQLSAEAERAPQASLTLNRPVPRAVEAAPMRRTAAIPDRKPLARAAEPAPNPRSRVMVDEDLFDVGGGVDRRVAAAGRR